MIQAWPPRAGRAAHQMPVRGSGGRRSTACWLKTNAQLTREIDRLTIELHNRLVGKPAL